MSDYYENEIEALPVAEPPELLRYSSISALLKLFNVPLTPQDANKILVQKGILLELYRPSLKHQKETRCFRVLSKKGLKFGRNIPNPVHPAETQVHYWVNTFDELVNILFEE